MKKTYIVKDYLHMLHGGDYNPDQWVNYPHILKEDIRLMRLANCNVMTVGIFAWATLEPEEGVFDFSLLDKTLDNVYAAGGRVILATPSGARPAWLARKYPEVLRYTDTFQPYRFGRRHNHCYTSPVYREKIAIINGELAKRYKDHPAVIAWHIGNEYNGQCFCPNCQKAFRVFLKEKYGTLEALNEQWWSRFWSHTYTDWEQIDPPSPMADQSTLGRNVDWHRFVSRQTQDFIRLEVEAVRRYAPHLPVTSNLLEFQPHMDNFQAAKELDFTSIDVYPPWRGRDNTDVKIAKQHGLKYDLTRSMLHRPFLLMENAPGQVDWHPYNKLKRPGMDMLTGMQAVAHGSDSVLYFQFRKGRGGQEKFHGAVVDHEGSENTRVFRTVAAIGERLRGLDELVGTHTEAKVALLYDWGNAWMLQDTTGFQRENKKLMETVECFYGALWDKGIDTDVVGVEDTFDNYKVILAPMLYAVSEETGRRLREYVNNGGILLGTYTTAMVNENDLCYLGGFPGAGLREVFGIWNEEMDTLYPDESNRVRLADGTVVTAVDYCEQIHAETAQVLARYDSDFYAGNPAVTVNRYGKGSAYYVAFRDKGDYTARLVGELLEQAGVRSAFDGALPHGVTAHARTDGESTYVFLQNFTYAEQTVETAQTWVDMEKGAPLTGTLTLQPLETRILKK